MAEATQLLLDEALSVLSFRQREIIKMRFGLGTYSEHTLTEVGCRFHITKERVRQLENRAMRRLRRPEIAKRFEDVDELRPERRLVADEVRCAAATSEGAYIMVLQELFSTIEQGSCDSCWPWIGCIGSLLGYGVCGQNPTNEQYAHRALYAALHGPIPHGLFVCHKCDNPICCNPDHLFLGTPGDNIRDRDRKGRGRRGGVLSEDQVLAIRDEYDGKWGSQSRLAKIYKVAPETIGRIIHRHIYKWVALKETTTLAEAKNK